MYWGGLSTLVVCVSVGLAFVTGSSDRSSCSVSYTDDGTEVVTCGDGSSLVMTPVGAPLKTDQLDFRGRALEQLDFRSITLRAAQFQAASLHQVNFHGVDLTGTDFSRAVLVGVDFTSADLTGVNFEGARFDGVQVKGAVWSETTCPTGISSEKNGGTCEGQMKP